jgi:hypothetical protein
VRVLSVYAVRIGRTWLISVSIKRNNYTLPQEVLTRGESEMSEPYDYETRETEVAIEGFVNRLVELYPNLDPIRLSELVSGLVEDVVTAAERGEEY